METTGFEFGADGPSASTQAGHRLVGSLATKLVRHATWPVTVVP